VRASRELTQARGNLHIAKKQLMHTEKKTPRSKLKTVTICTRIASKTYTHRIFLIKAKKGEINEIAY